MDAARTNEAQVHVMPELGGSARVNLRLPASPPTLPGLTYVRPLGSGGFADVFLYIQDMPRRQVAVKVLPSDVRDPELRRMFNAEADILAYLSAHPAIVTVYQAGVSADGRPYIVMEFCPGTLGTRYRAEKIPLDEALDIGVRTASAVESMHRVGLVHRDVKPSNLLVTSYGLTALADFGIASSLRQRRDQGIQAMTIPWSAPEVVAHESGATVASEVWSLGATVYALLAGRSPFERTDGGPNTPDDLRARITKAKLPPIDRHDVPDQMYEVLRGAMRRKPGDRYSSALQFARALRAVQRTVGITPTTIDVPEEAWVPSRDVDLDDSAARGPVRSSLGDRRRKGKPRPDLISLTRDEDTDFTGVQTLRTVPAWWWLVSGGVSIAALSVLVTLWVVTR